MPQFRPRFAEGYTFAALSAIAYGVSPVLEIEFHGQTLKPGQKVMLMWASANRDEREFEVQNLPGVVPGIWRVYSWVVSAGEPLEGMTPPGMYD